MENSLFIETITRQKGNAYSTPVIFIIVSLATTGLMVGVIFTGLPNFKSGWMKLNNGKKALVYLTSSENVLIIPTKDFFILFSMEKSNEFINKQPRGLP